jgi:hypothetical protein
MKLLFFLGVAILAGLLMISSAFAEPPKLPMSVTGTVYLDDTPAPARTVIEAHGMNVNPLTATLITTEPGVFGGEGTFDPKVLIQGGKDTPVPDNTPITFTVNGQPATVTVRSGETGTAIPYIPGESLVVTLRTGSARVIDRVVTKTATPTPIPTPRPAILSVSVPVVTATPTQSPNVYTLPSSVVRDTLIPNTTCPGIPCHSPLGYSALHVGAWGSEALFYLNGAIISNGGPVTIRGIPPGQYTLSYRENGTDPQDIPLIIQPNRYITVEVNPVFNSSFQWQHERVTIKQSQVIDDIGRVGNLVVSGYKSYDTKLFIDDRPVNFTCYRSYEAVTPGVHMIRVEIGGYSSEFPVFLGAGVLTWVEGGMPVQGLRCDGMTCSCPDTCSGQNCVYIPADPVFVYHGA